MASSASEVEEVSSISVQNVKFQEPIESTDPVPPVDFSTVSLDVDEETLVVKKKQKVPRRILHFSDGILEEYSTDEDETDTQPKPPPVDPKTLTWLPWFWYYMVTMATGALSVADSCGERLSSALGITSPKYQYAIDEYHRIKKEDEEERGRESRERAAEQKRMADQMIEMEGAIELNTFHSDSPSGDASTEQQQQQTTVSIAQDPERKPIYNPPANGAPPNPVKF